MTEYWTRGASLPGLVASTARKAEADGWDGIMLVDSQNLYLDCYVVMALATTVTTTLKLSTGVTNPFTRHAAITAGAIASIQSESGGRASLGIGRGDSALAYLGLAPVSVSYFERYVRDVQTYLSGGAVRFDTADLGMADLSTLHLDNLPDGSHLNWIDSSVPKVPVEVVATGPKVIGVGARHADMVTFTVGADLERLRWAIETARVAEAECGRHNSSLRFGAYINVVCHPDRALARRLVSGGLATYSHYSVMHGSPTGPLSGEADAIIRDIRAKFDHTRKSQADTSQTAVMTDEFIDRFAVAGPPEYCAGRIDEIARLGIERVVISTPSKGTCAQYPAETADANRYLVEQLLPKLRCLR